jgi:hypothetical protein
MKKNKFNKNQFKKEYNGMAIDKRKRMLEMNKITNLELTEYVVNQLSKKYEIDLDFHSALKNIDKQRSPREENEFCNVGKLKEIILTSFVDELSEQGKYKKNFERFAKNKKRDKNKKEDYKK